MSEIKTLNEKIIQELGKQNINKISIPDYINDNLSKNLREYQIKALQMYIGNNDKDFSEFKQNHLMFNMATGSGKTLVMVALILDCYQKGYENFIFFVNSKTILDKTKANFIDKASSKYLFSQNIEINEIQNFNESKDGCINILFSTVQGLFSILKDERENALSIEDFKERKIVFLADEAHHLNADTKKKLSKTQEFEKNSWEGEILKAFKSHKDNLMFEFSATLPNDKEVQKKYHDKIIYQYDLNQFSKEGFTKRIILTKYEEHKNSLENRFLGAVILSLYRQLVARKYDILLKPVVLFKSESISESNANQEKFIEFINQLDSKDITNWYKSINSDEYGLFAKSLEFFKNSFGEHFFTFKLEENIKIFFNKHNIINVNEEKSIEANQILLNTLEDVDNQIRVIFAVNKLNEGWDVLNLFDIVRLGNKKSNLSITTQEAQLIGRGARYFPFTLANIDSEMTYKRKFDNDLNNELSAIERLSYHTLNESSFISELEKELNRQGLSFEESKKRIILKPTHKAIKITQENSIYYAKNERIRKKFLFIKDSEKIAQDLGQIPIPLFSTERKEDELNMEKTLPEVKEIGKFKILNEVINDFNIFLKAMRSKGMSFENLKDFKNHNNEVYFNSKRDFFKFLGKIKFEFCRKQKFEDRNIQLQIIQFILENFNHKKTKILREFEVEDFKVSELKLKEREIFTTKKDEIAHYEWLYYDRYLQDSSYEKDFLDFIEKSKDYINEAFKEWIVIRNDGFEEFKIYDNREGDTYGMGFEPDFIFFGKRKFDERFLSIECFIEAKGKNRKNEDKWKEDFLKSIKNKEFKIYDNSKLMLDSMPFFISNDNDDFKENFEIFLKKNQKLL